MRYLIITSLLIIHLLIILSVQQVKSPTYDEGFYTAYGYSLWSSGDYRMAIDKPPLAPMINSLLLPFLNLKSPADDKDHWEKTGLWTKMDVSSKKDLEKPLGSRWNLGLNFLYDNTKDADTIIKWARAPSAFLSLLFALGIYWCALKLWGGTAGIIAFVMYILSPNIIANASIATEDFAVTGFFFLASFFFWLTMTSDEKQWPYLSGLFTALALLSKFTAILLIPVFIGLMALNFNKSKIISSLLPFFSAFAVTLMIFYKFVNIKYLYYGLRNMYFLQSIGQQSFLMGKYSGQGFWNYYLTAFLVKTPLPVIILMILGLMKIPKARKKTVFMLCIPAVIIMIAASMSSKQIGLRYILPVYPFVFLLASRPKASVFTFLIGAWFIFTSVKTFPDYMAYFNETVGGPDRGYEVLVDSNMDWGQDLKGLRDYVKSNGNPSVILSYYGACLSKYVGFPFQDLYSFSVWGDKSYIAPDKPKKELLAVSVTNLQGVYLAPIGRNILHWLKKRKPIKKIGYSIFLYDITNDVGAHRHLEHLYRITGQQRKAEREARRITKIEKITKNEPQINADEHR